MKKHITPENLSGFCITNTVKGDIRALAIEFPGLDGNSCLGGNYEKAELDSEFARRLGEQGILLVYVFTGPWNWMRSVAKNMVDEIVDAVKIKYALPEDVKIITVGGSMGGLGALMYGANTKNKITACAVSCPVSDLEVAYHFAPYWAATTYLAFGDCEGDLWDAIRYHSPVNRAEDMPDIPYFIICCDGDVPVPMESHACVLIERMKAAGKNVEYIVLEGMGHCEHTPEAMDKFIEFIVNSAT